MYRCNLCKCFWVSVLIIFMLPYYSALFHRAGPYEATQFAKARQVLIQSYAKCDNPERRKAIAYTLERYDRLGPFDVAICPLIGCAGANVPWCPGIAVDHEFLDEPATLAGILLHEAIHDYSPCFGHTRHKQLGVW